MAGTQGGGPILLPVGWVSGQRQASSVGLNPVCWQGTLGQAVASETKFLGVEKKFKKKTTLSSLETVAALRDPEGSALCNGVCRCEPSSPRREPFTHLSLDIRIESSEEFGPCR